MSQSGKQEVQDIIELAKLLRNSGDKVLSAESKLSLSCGLLNSLNEAFSLIISETDDLESSFQVCNSSRNELFRDIKFLHDFVQKTVGLKITNVNSSEKKLCDITKFRHLKFLELQKISIDDIKGIQGVRGQLECIICTGGRSLSSIGELLESCGADAGVGFIWASLRRLAIPYNNLTHLDNSLEYAPWLQTLDLSHNHLKRAAELVLLPNLKNVNLGFNDLETVPNFHRSAHHNLQKLILKNNYIEYINELQNLDCLVELDLSYNCLTDHSNLWPLETMSVLLWVCLEGNPLAYHPRHRLHSIKHFHPALADSKFILDNSYLNRGERLFVSENRVFSIRPTRDRSVDNLSSMNNSMISDISSVSIETLRGNQSSDNLPNFDVVVTKLKRKKNVKEAFIADLEQEVPRSRSNEFSKTILESSMEHLETKRQILALRAKFGEDNWLSSHAGAHIQSIMGIQTTIEGPTSSPYNNAEITKQVSPSPEASSNADQPETESPDVEKEISIEREEIIASEKQTDAPVIQVADLSEAYDPDEEKGDLYLVQKVTVRGDPEEIFLIITLEDIKERDSITGRIKYRWATNTVLSCVINRSKPPTVNIIFDTTRRDRESRTYITKPEDAKKIVATLNELIKSHPMILKVFKCMKCATHFSRDDENTIAASVLVTKAPKCPTCQSTLVIQTDELSGPSEVTRTQGISEPAEEAEETTAALRHSASQSSIDLGGRKDGAMLIPALLAHNSNSHPQSQISRSATSLDDSRESTPSAATVTKKCESDIEILSNPSQSSIEVLEEAPSSRSSLTPNRKKSIDALSPLMPIQDLNPVVMIGLTESSSSGSLTDSVCTAYENKAAKVGSGTKHDAIGTPAQPYNLTMMLGDLLQSMKAGPSKDLASKSEENPVQYSYTDFSNVDHRIKLHIILNIFEHENEELALLLRADILTQSSINTFPGCLVLSTAKVYILKIIGIEGDSPENWLLKESSWTIDRLRSFAPLPFKQGIMVELEQHSKSNNNVFLCILQDFQRTSNFMLYMTDSLLPASCELEFTVPQHCSTLARNALKLAKNYKQDEPVRLLALFSSAIIKFSDQTVKLNVSSLIITSSTLVILEDKIQWLLPGSDQIPAIQYEQAMSNLIEVDFNDKSLNLSFLDEAAGYEMNWILEFVSTNAAEAVINSIRPPWEELFSVPLQVNVPENHENS